MVSSMEKIIVRHDDPARPPTTRWRLPSPHLSPVRVLTKPPNLFEPTAIFPLVAAGRTEGATRARVRERRVVLDSVILSDPLNAKHSLCPILRYIALCFASVSSVSNSLFSFTEFAIPFLE